MDSRRFVLLLVSLTLIAAASGCTLPDVDPFDSQTETGYGVIIESFSPDFPEAYSGEEVLFSLKLKNTGSVKAEGAFAELLGLDQVWEEGSYTEVLNQEVLPVEPRCRYTSPESERITLLPEDTITGMPGEEEMCTWRYVAPDVLQGLSITSTPRARLFYSYSSTTIKTITFVSRDELKAMQNQGRSLPSETYSKTKSPVSLDLETRSPIRTYGSKVEFPIVITITNTGGGTVCSSLAACKKSSWTGSMPQEDGWNKLSLDIITPPGMRLTNCGSTGNAVYLSGDSPQSMSCKVEMDTGQIIGITQKNIELHAKYGYFIDKTTSITVYPSNKPA